MDDVPMMYDINTDERRPVTQEDVDRWQEIFHALGTAPRAEVPPEETGRCPDFRLAIYPNRMRDDGVFVAEERPIEPYKGISGSSGETLYPSVPDTPYSLRGQLPHAFAYELVRRWNKHHG
jgi:hypothetical protein